MVRLPAGLATERSLGSMLAWHSVRASASSGPSSGRRTARRPVRGGITVAHDERRLEVLRAIVQDYVSTNDPVGSKALAERHDLGVSPATIRNDMAVLEEQGYSPHPHTSPRRVPTDKGYRLFVARLSAVKPLSVAERRAIERFLDGA